MGGFTRGDLFEKELRRLVEEEIVRLTTDMSFGMLKSIDEYRSVTGRIAGLRQTLEYMDEASSHVDRVISS
jgi:hypothetical protein